MKLRLPFLQSQAKGAEAKAARPTGTPISPPIPTNRQPLHRQQTQLADLGKSLESEKSGREVEQKGLAAAREEIAKLTGSLQAQQKATGDAARNATAVAAVLATLQNEKGNVDRKLAELGASSKLNAEWAFLQMLFEEGRRSAVEFGRKHLADVGVRATFDLDSLIEEA